MTQARPRIIRAIDGISGFRGVTGEHTFDQFGDTSNKALTVYQVAGHRWRDVFTTVAP